MKKIITYHKQYKGSVCESRGASGGIATLWDQNTWSLIAETIHQHWINTALENTSNNQRIVIYNVYAPNHYRDKEQCWGTLKEIIDEEENNNIILGGDLNLILHSNEKQGGCFSSDPYRN